MIEGRGHSRVVTEPVRDQDPLDALAGALAAPDERYRTLFETMPMGIVHYDADGSVIGANQAAGQILGIDLTAARTWPVVPADQTVREDGSPFPREDLPVLEALRTGRIVTDTVAGIRHAKTGEFRWVRVTAVPDARDEFGQPSRAYAIFIDLTEQRRTEAALRQSTALLGRLRDANVLGVVVAGEHQVYEANDAYLDIIGYRRDDLEADRIAWREISPPEWAVVQDEALRQLQQAGVCQPFEKEYVHKDGHRVPVLIGSAAISRDPLRWTSFVVDLSARQRAERERAALLERARANRADAESARERLSFLMRAGALVAATRDRDELLDQVTHLVVPALADYCVVFLPTADGRLLASSLSHRVRARARLLSRLRDVEYLDDTAGIMLGAGAGTSFTAGRRRLSPGTRLLFYTDGLIEDRHRDITDGLTVLAETLRRSGPGSAAQTCATVDAALLSATRRHDDVCLLTARLTG